MIKQRIALLLVVVLLASLMGCASESTTVSETSQTSTVSTTSHTTKTTVAKKVVEIPGLCYCKTDSLNPYKAKTRVNQQLSSVLYEGLVTIKENWDVQMTIASKIEKKSATIWQVTLQKKAKFSDGKAVTTTDVINSFLLAKNATAYQALVADIQSIKAVDAQTVSVTFSSAVPWAERALSFPIVKEDLGTGPYYYNSKSKALEINTYAQTKPSIEKWRLEDVSRRPNQQYAVETENVQYYFTDLEDGEVSRVMTNTQITPVEIPYFIYMGVQTGRTSWKTKAIRKAISCGISRKSVGAAACAGYMTPAVSIFPSDMKGVSEWKGLAAEAQLNAAIAEIEKLDANAPTTAELIVPKSNASLVAAAKEIATELKAIGIKVTVNALDAGTYTSRVSSGNFDFYLAEIRLPDTLSLDAVLKTGGAGCHGMSMTAMANYSNYRSGKIDAKKLHELIMDEMPLIPLGWKQGLSMASVNLTEAKSSGADAYYNVQNWTWNREGNQQ